MNTLQPLHAFKELSNIIVFGAPMDDVFHTALEQMVAFMQADADSIQLLCENETFHTVAVQGVIGERLFAVRTNFTISESGLGYVLESDQAHVINDLTDTLELATPLARRLEQEQLTTAEFEALPR